MSKLDQLIEELCPSGVEYKKLKDVATISRGGSFQKKDYVDQGFPCIHYGQIYTLYGLFVNKTANYISENVAAKQKKAVTNDIVMAVTSENIDDVCKCVAWLGEGEVAVSGHAAIIHHTLNPKYLVYYLRSSMFFVQKVKLAHGTKVMEVKPDSLGDIVLPVPPIEIQCEIARILDKYTELTEKLTEELTEELTARKQQYTFYRDQLLTFDDSVPEYSMGDVLTFLNGRAYKQAELLGEGKYPVLRVGNFYTNSSWYYSDLELDEDKYCDTGDLLYSWAATLGPKIWDGGKCIFHYHIWKILFDETKIDKMFLYYYLQYDLAEIAKSTTQSTMVHVSMGSMKKRTIKIPPLDEQKRIAGLIAYFDNLCSSITTGLPAEIDARQKQYEYYRDKLLTFEEMRAVV